MSKTSLKMTIEESLSGNLSKLANNLNEVCIHCRICLLKVNSNYERI